MNFSTNNSTSSASTIPGLTIDGSDSFTITTVNVDNFANNKDIEPNAYFDYVKGKISKNEVKTLRENLKLLPSYIESARKLNHKAVVEALEEELALICKEQVLLSCGYDKHVYKSDVEEYINNISNRSVKICDLENFPRIIPTKVHKQILKAQEKALFDEYCVLYVDYTNQPVLNKEQEEVRKKNKDPIVFGYFTFNTSKLYYIADWIDEYCDLTLDKMVKELKNKDANYKVGKTGPITTQYLNNIVKEVQERAAKDKKKDKVEPVVEPKKSVFNRLFKWLKDERK